MFSYWLNCMMASAALAKPPAIPASPAAPAKPAAKPAAPAIAVPPEAHAEPAVKPAIQIERPPIIASSEGKTHRSPSCWSLTSQISSKQCWTLFNPRRPTMSSVSQPAFFGELGWAS